MEPWTLIWSLLSKILYTIGGITILILILILIIRLVKLNSLSFKPTAFQKGELIKKKMFKTKDLYELAWYGDIDPESEYILIGVHDLNRNRKDFERLSNYFAQKNNLISVVSFDQRNCGDNKDFFGYHPGVLISDLNEIVDSLSESYKSKKIIILAEGISFASCLYLSKNKNVHKIISSSLRLNIAYNKEPGYNFKLFMGTLFNMNTFLKEHINGLDLVDDISYAKSLEKQNLEKGRYSVRSLFLMNKVNNNIKRHINNSNNKVTLIQPTNDYYSDAKRTAKLLSALDENSYELILLKNYKHYTLNHKHSEEVFEKIENAIKKSD
ncbi:serine aminopeptidase domain-containing protein [Spiroplasma apis]|uniref:Serine aminopeptidase S33 domain-containing protein n=1 Tax=Spiroplasma apis B31 TaxID=1276258 RepID=V5RKL0_SPIAP|nr:alpha/beta hydrolase [Spiroplasma apis]AHB36646.1 hypothetical protein SAPIS_v1c08010 [Spiroplasma apis B31]